MPKHTDGGWRVEEADLMQPLVGTPLAEVKGRDGSYVVGPPSDWGMPDDNETRANARLISRAPRMYRGYERLIEIVDETHLSNELPDRIKTICCEMLQLINDETEIVTGEKV